LITITTTSHSGQHSDANKALRGSEDLDMPNVPNSDHDEVQIYPTTHT